VLAQCLSHRHSDAQAPGAGGLGSQQSRNPVDYRQRSTDPYLGRVEADIDPPQAEELSATGPGPERQMPHRPQWPVVDECKDRRRLFAGPHLQGGDQGVVRHDFIGLAATSPVGCENRVLCRGAAAVDASGSRLVRLPVLMGAPA
jgi:hypothetical protein